MNDVTITPEALELVRQDIDATDTKIFELLLIRHELVSRVKLAKAGEVVAWPLPIRPAREAEILRRLLDRAKGSSLAPQLLVRIWRAIICQSIAAQSNVTIHVSKHLAENIGLRLQVNEHFGTMAIESWRDEAQAMMQINAQSSAICIVETNRPWAAAFTKGMCGNAQVIAVLPTTANEDTPPAMLVFGEAPQAQTGDDETLVVSSGRLPRDLTPQPSWHAKNGDLHLSSIPGFLDELVGPLASLAHSNRSLGLKIAGRYSRAIII